VAGNAKGRKRRFGSIRKLPSGAWQARYTGPDGLLRTGPSPFDAQRAAERWLVETEADMLKGEWVDPDAGKVRLDEYLTRWIKERDLKPRTREEYERTIRLHVQAPLGHLALNQVNAQRIRTWRADRIEAGVGRSTIAKTYRILHTVFATAIDDDLIRRNHAGSRARARTRLLSAQRPHSIRSSRSPRASSRDTGS
jgi:Phage integrase, N-terminal SAM-like domain